MKEMLTRNDIIAELIERASRTTLKKLGRDLGGKKPISAGYLNDVIHGRKTPGPRILKALGLELVQGEVLYRRVRAVAKA